MSTKSIQRNKNEEKITLLIILGSLFVLLSPILFFLTPPVLGGVLCRTESSCGYAGLGVLGYALYFAIASGVVGFVFLAIGLYLQFRKYTKKI